METSAICDAPRHRRTDTRRGGYILKRSLDVTFASMVLIGAMPVLAVAALAIRVSSRGPVLYRAQRVGLAGRPFTMYKLRTMHAARAGAGSVITAKDDPRVFPLGAWLRRAKIDELPQLFNILTGQMSIVGPRPEDPDIVARYYSCADHETLSVRPGLTSPGTLYSCTCLDDLIQPEDPERFYVQGVLRDKLALDVLYVRRVSLWYDLSIIARTAWIVLAKTAGKRVFSSPPELLEAGSDTPGRSASPVP